ncbi:MAG: radical SAM protein [Thermoplasmata archaeon]|nr:radical SAM protein [Thermoplasmata archaeon]
MDINRISREEGFEVLEKTRSIDEKTIEDGKVPKTLDAWYIEKDGIVYLLKDNGSRERIGTREYWKKIMDYKVDDGYVARINTNREHCKDVGSCGLCKEHKNSTALLNIVATNRCDLRCWYCFFYEEKAGFVYEPSLKEIEKGIRLAKEMNGYTPPVQITGGEPILRKDVDKIIKLAKDLGSPHVQLNTNSVSLGIGYFENRENAVKIVEKWRKAGVNTIYTSFDGLKPDPNSNPKTHYEMPFALQAYKEGGIRSIVLVPTVSQINLKEVPDIVSFAMHNIDRGIRGVNFQPISLVGFIKKGEREKLRVVQSDIVDELRRKFGLGMEAWYPVPCVAALADLIGKEPHIHFYNNEKCGIATYVFVDRDGKKLIPITEFVDVDRFLKDVKELHDNPLKKVILGLEILPKAIKYLSFRKALAKKVKEYIIRDELPNGKRLSDVLDRVFAEGNYASLREFHYSFLFLGMMHFQDYYNYDINRVKRCSIHYACGDRIVPFCTYNVFPSIYRDKYLKSRAIKGKRGEKLMKESMEAKERVERFRERKDEIVNSPIYKEVYAI